MRVITLDGCVWRRRRRVRGYATARAARRAKKSCPAVKTSAMLGPLGQNGRSKSSGQTRSKPRPTSVEGGMVGVQRPHSVPGHISSHTRSFPVRKHGGSLSRERRSPAPPCASLGALHPTKRGSAAVRMWSRRAPASSFPRCLYCCAALVRNCHSTARLLAGVSTQVGRAPPRPTDQARELVELMQQDMPDLRGVADLA